MNGEVESDWKYNIIEKWWKTVKNWSIAVDWNIRG